jgi:hypothetical protein
MRQIHKCLIILSVSQSLLTGLRGINIKSNPITIYFTFMNLMTEILLKFTFIYKFPILFVSWTIINNSTFQNLIINLYKKYIN